MKRRYLFLIAILILSGAVFVVAQENKAAVGLGLEWNMNSREDFGGGAVIGFDYNLPVSVAPLALGLIVTTSYNFNDIVIVEPAALFRWYFLNRGHRGFFAQADLGAHILMQDGDTELRFLGGVRGGYRFPVGKTLYIEPYGRLGYPFAFSIGAMAGLRF